MLKNNSCSFSRRWSGLVLFVVGFGCTGAAQAKRVNPNALPNQQVQYVLTDPVSDLPLANTPYVLMTPHGNKEVPIKPMLTDDKGRTREVKEAQKYDLTDPAAPVVLVQAEGNGSQLLLLNLNDANRDPTEADAGEVVPSHVPKAAPYMIWNKDSNQALCGRANAQGFTQAYFVPANGVWNEGNYILHLKNGASCADARVAMAELNDDMDSDAFERGHAYAREHFVLTNKQADGFVYEHASDLIRNPSADIEHGANKRALERAIDLAKGKRDAAQLNMLGYGLGFERHAYKRSLPLLTEALNIEPNDCYYLNSKGYVLMRQGDLKASRELLQASDVACQAARIHGGTEVRDQDPAYPIAVNYAHLAENYGLSGDVYMANEFLNRALKEGAVRAKDEIFEVLKNLGEKKMVSDANLQLFALYLSYVEKTEAKNKTAVEGATKKNGKAVVKPKGQ
ncbi:hypothetical protein DTO96_101019 [Ephemeroptericola cinctiostellae]|uniref:Beta-barrel assembly-enhancing protease n=1 Tax=Ephemeroptericola cinctiostellae TaxID=2268024 RepID=A0A345DAA1_9BURK|nr:hypothetical protein [Ephemeroptericola cinctiostellae]AXF85289.1 hypothetical protein DTO96_101019 [Ephemeroptericola cinctiostellae]